MKNRFNNLTAKEWLPFQKSWFQFERLDDLFSQNILFFTQIKEDEHLYPNIVLQTSPQIIRNLQKRPELFKRKIAPLKDFDALDRIDFAVFDLLNEIEQLQTYDQFLQLAQRVKNQIAAISKKLTHRRFILILARNKSIDGVFYPFAWLIAKLFQQILSLKDEKIGVNLHWHPGEPPADSRQFTTRDDLIYALYFRKDEFSTLNFDRMAFPDFKRRKQDQKRITFMQPFPAWQIVKPPPRKKHEILHPAKYPEVLIESFITHFSKPGENIFDPMSGTGSTQLAAVKNKRNGYGVELSAFFAQIARQRLEQFLSQTDLFTQNSGDFDIKIKDAREIKPDEFPPVHYVITSPPYWDMLNMKGAENQAKRRQKGLQTNYSDSQKDLGNISEYERFLDELVRIYFKLYDLLLPGSYLTIIVKNIKKKGHNFPLAWDLSFKLSEKYILCPESFWFQDDLKIAPYGYGNTWVSNTFHHYCLNFQKPED